MTTYENMTTEHLGEGATDQDLRDFQTACREVLPAFDNDAEAATDWVWNSGDFAERLNAGTCIYCDSLVADRTIVPPADDAEAWLALGQAEHWSNCEWIVTRAHRLAIA